MSENDRVDEARRPTANRIGIAALNLLAPGLGLLRVQRPRAAIILLLASPILLGLLVLTFALVPDLGFGGWAATLALVLAGALVAYAVSIGLSWRASRPMQRPGPWWSRWYGIGAALAVVIALNWPLQDLALRYYRTFYLPSESMAPTMSKGDRFVARMGRPDALHRGDLLLVDGPGGHIYVKRVAGLPGDRIEMIDGILILNGRPVPQRFVRSDRVDQEPASERSVRRLAEQFTGEAAPHEIYDTGPSAGDDVAPMVVPPGHLYLLGDNRDHSADSRFSIEAQGMGGPAPVERVRGVPLAYLSLGRFGQPAGH